MPRLGKPKRLLQREPIEISFTAAYDPAAVESSLQELDKQPQDITVEYVELLFLGSPGCSLELVKGRDQFRGYLSEFKPDGTVEGEPIATSTMKVTP